jgi:hypothetical protein
MTKICSLCQRQTTEAVMIWHDKKPFDYYCLACIYWEGLKDQMVKTDGSDLMEKKPKK